jgi:hypothetical protein
MLAALASLLRGGSKDATGRAFKGSPGRPVMDHR